MATWQTVDEYVAALPAATRPAVEELRAIIRAAAPDAIEVIAYDMPGLRERGRLLISYAGYRAHCGLYAASGAVVAALGEELTPYLSGKGTIRLPLDRPIPADLVARIVAVRLAELANRKR